MNRPVDNVVTRRQLLTAIGGALVGSSLGACRRTGAAAEVRIGALCELSGQSSTIGTEQAHGIQFAVDEINLIGIPGHPPGVNGRPIRLYLEDSESKVSTGLAKAKKLIERDRVHALTGVIFSSISMAVQEFINKEAHVPFLNAGSSNPVLSQPPACGRYTFVGEPNSNEFALAAAYAAQRFGARWFFIADDYSWGRLTVDLTKAAIQRSGALEIVGEEYAPLGTTNYAPYITKAIAAKPDVIGLVVFGAGYARVLKQIRQMGATAHIHHNFWSQVDANAAGDAVVRMTAGEAFLFDNPKAPQALQFARGFHARVGRWPDPAAARGYNAVQVLARSIQIAGTTDPDVIVNAMERLTFPDSVLGAFRFRECDHQATTSMFVVEARFNDTYRYYGAYVTEVDNPDSLMVPCGKTGCEALVRQR
jgi:branched-chain amino acid transport system substrate-binding protein